MKYPIQQNLGTKNYNPERYCQGKCGGKCIGTWGKEGFHNHRRSNFLNFFFFVGGDVSVSVIHILPRGQAFWELSVAMGRKASGSQWDRESIERSVQGNQNKEIRSRYLEDYIQS